MNLKKLGIKFLKVAPVVAVSLCYALFPSNFEHAGNEIKSFVGQQTASVLDSDKPTGGPDYTPLAGSFLHTEGDYICDGRLWKSVGKMAIATYATSTETGDVFQFDLIPTGLNVANIQFGRRKTYEVSFGANSYEHLFAQNLQDNSIIGFVDKDESIIKGRFNMGFSLSSSTENTIRIEEEVVSENSLKLKITVKDKTFVTEEFQVTNHKKYNVVYFGLLDDKENSNQTGMIAPELRICP